MKGVGKAFRWWRAQKVERPLLRGAVFWASFWGVSVAAIAWVYAPGGIGDPERDARVQVAPKRAAAGCVVACIGEPSPQPVATVPVSVAGTQDGRVVVPSATPSVSVRPSVPVNLPDFKPPTITIDVIDQFVLAGNRYAHYRALGTAGSKLTNVTIMTDVPARTWFVECNYQGGQQVCIDQYEGEAEGHRISATVPSLDAGESRSADFWVRIDASVPAGEKILDHAHIVWDGGSRRSSTHELVAPSPLAP